MSRLYLIYLAALLAATLAAPVPAAVDRDGSQAYYEQAMEFFRAAQFPEATIQLKNAVQRDPKNLAARIMLGKVLLCEGQPLAAIKELEMAQAMGGDENLILVPLAQAYIDVAEHEHVITGFVAEGHLPAVDGELYILQAEAYLQLGSRKPAEEAYLSAGVLMPIESPTDPRTRAHATGEEPAPSAPGACSTRRWPWRPSHTACGFSKPSCIATSASTKTRSRRSKGCWSCGRPRFARSPRGRRCGWISVRSKRPRLTSHRRRG